MPAHNKQFRQKVGRSDNPCDNKVINCSLQSKQSCICSDSSSSCRPSAADSVQVDNLENFDFVGLESAE